MFTRLQQQRFSEGCTPISDDEFLSAQSVAPHLQRFVVAAREVLGCICRVPAALIRPDDAPSFLARLVGDWDDLVIAMELESRLGTPIDEIPQFLGGRFFWYSRPGPRTVGEWTISVAQCLYERIHHNVA
jgi:hypothetical protein